MELDHSFNVIWDASTSNNIIQYFNLAPIVVTTLMWVRNWKIVTFEVQIVASATDILDLFI